MAALAQRPCAGDADRDAVIALWAHARSAALDDPWPPLDTLHAELAATPEAPAAARLWDDRRGDLVAAALLLDGCVLAWRTRAGVEDELLDAELIAWGLDAVAAAAHDPGERAALFVPVPACDGRLAALLQRAGFEEDAWRTLRMVRSLHEPIPSPVAPDDVAIRPVADAADLAAAVALHNALFAGGRKTPGERAAIMRAPGYRPALDLVAVGALGAAVGYTLGMRCALERALLGEASGWLEFVGVDRSWRGHGLGRALTLQLLHAMRADGADKVRLTTGTANGAARALFAGCGFRVSHEIRWFVHA